MKDKRVLLLLMVIGLAPSYVFTSLLMNQAVVPPWDCFGNTTVVLTEQAIHNGIFGAKKGIDGQFIVSEETMLITVENITGQTGNLVTVSYRFDFETQPEEAYANVYYAAAGQPKNTARMFSYRLNDQETTIDFRPYTNYIGPIDSVWIEIPPPPTPGEAYKLAVEKVSLNEYLGFSWGLFIFVYMIYLAIVIDGYFVDKRQQNNKNKVLYKNAPKGR